MTGVKIIKYLTISLLLTINASAYAGNVAAQANYTWANLSGGASIEALCVKVAANNAEGSAYTTINYGSTHTDQYGNPGNYCQYQYVLNGTPQGPLIILPVGFQYICSANTSGPIEININGASTRVCTDTCSLPQLYNSQTFTCEAPKKGNGSGCPSSTHPISIGTGNKWLAEYDYRHSSSLSFERGYNSNLIASQSGVGSVWVNKYTRLLSIVNSESSPAWVLVTRPSGKEYRFNLNSSDWLPDTDLTDKLIQVKNTSGVTTGWTYTVDATSEVEAYDANGYLLSITDRAGNVQSMTYSTSSTPTSIAPVAGLLITVTDSLGRSLNFTYDSANRIQTMTNPAGGIYTYAYDTNGNLSSVTYPDSKVKTYLYGEAANVSTSPNTGVSYLHALTGIIDENNSRYVTYAYDSSGRAYDEYLAPGLGLAANQRIDHNSLVYNVDGSGNPTSTVVTDALGSARTYNFTTILGVVKSTGQSQPAGSGCAASAAAMSYDANGNVATRTDFNGNKTSYVYDLTRNLETSRTEGLTTAGAATTATRTITTTWHPTWRLPLVITEYTGAAATGTALKKTTYVYDTKGNVTSFKQEDPVRSLSRTTTVTYTYSTAVPGLVLTKVVDGSRTDANDLTTYTYYPHDASCVASTSSSTATNLGCRGQLQSVKNALNQTTTYDRYNHHGQVEQMTDPNGMVITNSYDLRQRLLSSVVSGTGVTAQTTSLSYDNAGQITQLKMPDNSTLNYSYDPAHRLTQVQDTLSNKVVYTLDSEGNRTNENTYDPSGTLAKTITRSYDALNRLQTLTGQE